MTQYFNKFPNISYDGVTIKNITLRTRLLDNFRQNANNFYPYIIKDDETADALAYDYYDDPNYVWVIYLTNDIIDPYYDWPLSSYNFENFIKEKYGSLYDAQSTIAYYRKKTQSYYVNTLTNEYKLSTEYNPVVDGYGWQKVDKDEEIRISSATTPDLTIWEAVTAYDDEFEQNEARRHIKLLDKRIVATLETQLRDLLNE